MEFNSIALRKDKTQWSLSLLPSERTKLNGVLSFLSTIGSHLSSYTVFFVAYG